MVEWKKVFKTMKDLRLLNFLVMTVNIIICILIEFLKNNDGILFIFILHQIFITFS